MAADRSHTNTTEADVREIRTRLWSFVRRRVSDDATADDVTQDVLVRWMTSPPGPDAPLIPWLLVVARNALADRQRRQGRTPAVEVLPADVPALEDASPESSPLLACVRPLLEGLSSSDRDVLQRYDLGGDSATADAQARGSNPSTSRSRLRRARQRLRGLIERCCRLELDGTGLPIDIDPRRCSGEDSAPCGSACHSRDHTTGR